MAFSTLRQRTMSAGYSTSRKGKNVIQYALQQQQGSMGTLLEQPAV